MERFILLELVDGNFCDPDFYKDFSGALSSLHVRMAEACGYTEREIPLMLKQAEQNGPDLGYDINWDEHTCIAWVQDYDEKTHEYLVQKVYID